MDEIVKEPIYRSYTRVIMPALFNNLKEMRPEKVQSYAKNFEILFEGMIEILKTDTRKVERKIKRVSDAQKAAGILNFNLEF
jgi:hypothetical protein